MSNEIEFEFLVVVDGRKFVETWTGKTFEDAAKRLLDCKYPEGKVIAWRHARYAISTTLPRC